MSGFLKNASKYSAGSVLTTLAGIISFPILTRAFDVDDYGKFGLVAATLSILVGISKLGFNHSTVRFYSDIKAGNTGWTEHNFYSTIYVGMLLVAGVVSLLWVALNYSFGMLIWDDKSLAVAFVVTASLILVRVVESAMMNVLKAQEKASLFSLYIVIKRYAVLASVIVGVYFLYEDLIGLYILITLCEWLVFIFFAFKWVPFKHLRPRWVDRKLFILLCTFGIPMFGMEISSVLLSVGDRYVINLLLNATDLGLYSSAYALAEYSRNIVSMGLAFSAIPIYLRLNAEEGVDSATRFIEKAIRNYCWIMVPICFGMAAVASPLIITLAGEKYADGHIIIPWIVAALGLQGAFSLSGAGLYLARESKKLFLIVFVTAVINIAINFILIPILGIKGAAISSLICMAILFITSYVWSRKHIQMRLPVLSFVKSLLAGFIMYKFVSYVSSDILILSLLFKIFIGMLVYISVIYTIDGVLRKQISVGINR